MMINMTSYHVYHQHQQHHHYHSHIHMLTIWRLGCFAVNIKSKRSKGAPEPCFSLSWLSCLSSSATTSSPPNHHYHSHTHMFTIWRKSLSCCCNQNLKIWSCPGPLSIITPPHHHHHHHHGYHDYHHQLYNHHQIIITIVIFTCSQFGGKVFLLMRSTSKDLKLPLTPIFL